MTLCLPQIPAVPTGGFYRFFLLDVFYYHLISLPVSPTVPVNCSTCTAGGHFPYAVIAVSDTCCLRVLLPRARPAIPCTLPPPRFTATAVHCHAMDCCAFWLPFLVRLPHILWWAGSPAPPQTTTITYSPLLSRHILVGVPFALPARQPGIYLVTSPHTTPRQFPCTTTLLLFRCCVPAFRHYCYLFGSITAHLFGTYRRTCCFWLGGRRTLHSGVFLLVFHHPPFISICNLNQTSDFTDMRRF